MNEPEGQVPAAPPPPAGPENHSGNPWERRSSGGAFSAFVDAIKLFVTSPREAFSQTAKSGDFGSPLIFAIVVGWIGAIIGQIWSMAMGASFMSLFPSEIQQGLGTYMAGSTVGFVVTLIFAPVFIIIALFIWAAILHLCLVIVGGLEQSEGGFEGTFRVVSYSSVAQLSNVIPVFGGLVGFVWTMVLAVIGTKEIHGTSQGKAIAAILIPAVLCCVCVAIAMFAAGAGLVSYFASQ